MTAGDTFMLEDDDGASEHLHVVLTDPSQAGEVVTTCICTKRRWSETLVSLRAGDHPFIIRDSVVSYGFSAIRDSGSIAAAIAAGKARKKQSVSADLLRRMQAGLIDSDFTPPAVRAFFRAITKQ